MEVAGRRAVISICLICSIGSHIRRHPDGKHTFQLVSDSANKKENDATKTIHTHRLAANWCPLIQLQQTVSKSVMAMPVVDCSLMVFLFALLKWLMFR